VQRARDGACVRYAEEVTDKKKEPTRVREAPAGCTAETSSADHCASGKCDVTIGGKTYCSQCATGYVPIDGTCTQVGVNTSGKCLKAGGTAVGQDDTHCGQCGANYFLHKGGCYQIEGTPGSAICKTAGAAGICQACQAGYFKNPANSNQKDSCIACGDTTGDTTNNNKGVQNCATCTVEGAETTGKTAKCTACVDGYFANSDGSACGACDDNANCATCSGAATQCTSCKGTGTKLYFKKGTGETGECVAEADCNGNYLPTTDTSQKKICTLCSDATNSGIADCQTCSKSGTAVKCSACTALHPLLTAARHQSRRN
ncbi:Variant-specific surface protein, partial [Giardia duodenalis]